MPNEKWKHIQWKRDGSDNALIREFLADPDNIGNCKESPYKMEHPSHDALPCGQYHCWVELSC